MHRMNSSSVLAGARLLSTAEGPAPPFSTHFVNPEILSTKS
jgi:hypothetical protein